MNATNPSVLRVSYETDQDTVLATGRFLLVLKLLVRDINVLFKRVEVTVYLICCTV
jgi:hypothetical protein